MKTHCKLQCAVLLLLVCYTFAADTGTLFPGKFTDMAQDGAGCLWAVREDSPAGLVRMKNKAWVQERIGGLADGAAFVTLTSAPDGDVLCLWRDVHEEDQYVLTRHQGEQSRVWSKFKATLNEPRVLGRNNMSAFISGRGRTIVHIPAGGLNVVVSDLHQELFISPKKQSDGSTPTSYVPIHAVEDAENHLWLWSPAMQAREYDWRLRSIVQTQVDPVHDGLKEYDFAETGMMVSVIVPWDAHHMMIGVSGQGLLKIALSGKEAEFYDGPGKEGLRYVEQLFHDGVQWNAILTPQPTEYSIKMSKDIGNRLQVGTTSYYDTARPADSLSRFVDEGKQPHWEKVLGGLDKQPAFGQQRLWIATPAGLWLGSHGSAPWFIPKDQKSKPVWLEKSGTFPLPAPRRGFAVDASTLVFLDQSGTACLWSSTASPAVSPNLARWEEISTRGPALQDSKGNVWCVRDDSTFAKWDGHEWHTLPLPKEALASVSSGFVSDDHDQGWTPAISAGTTAICDFNTGNWQVYPSLQKALEAQLPQGVLLSIPELPVCEHVYSKDGRIGAYAWESTLMLYDKPQGKGRPGAWQTWDFHSIAGPDARLAGTPFFDPKGLFSVPIEVDAAWQWHGKDGWKRADNITVPKPGTLRRPEAATMPADWTMDKPSAAFIDRYGVTWALMNNKELHKAVLGRNVPVFQPDETNPFRHGGTMHSVLADPAGNVFIGTNEHSHLRHYFLIRSRQPVPQPVVQVAATKEDSVTLLCTNKTPGETWYAWRLDDGNWQAVTQQAQRVFAPLAAGKHRVEVRAYSADLSPAPEPAAVEFDIKIDADAQFAKLIAQLGSPELDQRERAARSLVMLGPAILPKLTTAQRNADEMTAWWLQAVTQRIVEAQRKARP